MTFSPILNGSGLTGWYFLKSTYAKQQDIFAKTGAEQRIISQASDQFSKTKDLEGFLADHRLRQVAYGAFGLSSDMQNHYFMKKIITSDLDDATSVANRLANKKYVELAKTLKPLVQGTPLGASEVQKLSANYIQDAFEQKVGEQNNAYRMALYAERTVSEIANAQVSNNTKWYRVMGDRPLRTVFETVFGLPSSFGKLDVDQQLTMLKDKAEQHLGTSDMSKLSEPGALEDLVQTYIVKDQLTQGQVLTARSTALALLQNTFTP